MPPLPASFSRDDLRAAGFEGWLTWDQLRALALAPVPSGPAAYVIYRSENTEPSFLEVNPAGHFKGRDPTVARPVLEAKWVPQAHVVYIGKADAGRRRLREFARYGAGEPVGHQGGRYIWQLADSDDLLVAWHGISWSETARGYEKRLMAHFEQLHGDRMPLANLTH